MSSDGASGETSSHVDGDDKAIARAPVRRNIMHMLGSQAATWVLATAYTITVPRMLGPETGGQLRLTWSLWTIAMVVLGLGTSTYLQLEIAKRTRAGLPLVGPVLILRTVAWMAAAVAILVYTAVVHTDVTLVGVSAVIGLTVLVSTWADVLSGVFSGLERMSVPAAIGVETKLINNLGTIVLLWIGFGVWGVVVGGVSAAAWSLLRYGLKFRPLGPIVFTGWTRSWRSILRGGAPFLMAAVAIVVYQQIDIIVISWIASSRDLGWYAAGESLIGTFLVPSAIVLAAIFPTLGRLQETDPALLDDFAARAFSLVILVAVPVGLGVMVVAPTFVPLLYGSEFSGTADVLVALGPMLVFTSCTTMFGGIAMATGRAVFWTKVVLVSAAMTVPLDLVLVRWTSDRFDNGAIGGALSYAVTEAFQFIVGVVVIAPYLVNRVTIWRTCRVLAAGLVMLACTWPLRDDFLVLPIAVGVATYVGAVLLLRVLSDYEVGLLRQALRRG